MSEIALYRKYRPKAFKEVIGQDPIVEALSGSIVNSKISHAYLFSGPRGTGKTSMARIFAEAVGTKADDLNEIDGASNTGVDNIRELREGVNTLPFTSRFKIYIIDEVHMLSKGAFNALLKTLEEPPGHVIFILATTELGKIPETIVSRCQTFSFKKPTLSLLREMAVRLAKKEGFSLEPSSADLIALLGDGSFRDTQGILQKIISASKDKKISVKEVEAITGAPKATLVNDYIHAIVQNDVAQGLGALSEALKQNIDAKIYTKLLLRKMRAILLLRLKPDVAGEFKEEFSAEDFDFIKKLSEEKDSKINSGALLEVLNVYDLIGYAVSPMLPLELALVKLVDSR